jgi:predicted phage terminase large subunit-like protein
MNRASIKEHLNEKLEWDYQNCERSFCYFTKTAWKVLEPETELLWNWHHALVAEHLIATLNGQITRLIINIPPRYMKSIMASICFPAWCWVKKPSLRFLFSSYSASLSTKHSKDRRDLIESAWYRERWKYKFSLATDQNVKTEFVNSRRGHMIATSMLGTATGKGGDYVVIDDPHDPKKAESEALRESTLEAFDRTFSTRLDNKKTGRIIVIMQRLHQKDLTGHLLKEKGKWTHLSVPATESKQTIVVFPVTKRERQREPFTALHPEREDVEDLRDQKKTLGTYGYAGQYDQRPTPRGGGMFKRKWWRFYTVVPNDLIRHLQSWDLTFKDTKTSKFVCGTIWARRGADKYLLDQSHGRMDFPTTIFAIKALTAKWPQAKLKLVEDKANGPAVLSVLKKKISGLVAVQPKGSKEERAAAVTPQCESGNVYLPDPSIAPWINDFLAEFDAFPKGEFNDRVDSTTMALERLDDQIHNQTGAIPVSLSAESKWRK